MLTVQYPPAAVTVHVPEFPPFPPFKFPSQVRGYVVDDEGFIRREISMPYGAAQTPEIVTTYLPPFIRRPRWDGTCWVETLDETPAKSTASAPQVRGYAIDDRGFISFEISVAYGIPAPEGVVTAYLPTHIKQPRWDGQAWIETHGWWRALLRWFEAKLT